jgi:hypothetical protein
MGYQHICIVSWPCIKLNHWEFMSTNLYLITLEFVKVTIIPHLVLDRGESSIVLCFILEDTLFIVAYATTWNWTHIEFGFFLRYVPTHN